jgi:hypothetical protein
MARITALTLLKSRLAPLRPFLKRMGEPKRLWLGAGLVLALTVLLSSNLIPDKVTLQVGDLSPEELRAHRTVEYISALETQHLRDEAAKRVPNVYDEIPYATSDALENVGKTFRLIADARSPQNPLSSSEFARLKRRLPLPLTDATVLLLLNTKPDGLNALKSAAERLVEGAMSDEIRDMPSDLPRVRLKISTDVRGMPGFSPMERVALADIAGSIVRPNRALNSERTERLRDEERLSVRPVPRQILKGEIVLHKDEPVTPDHIEKLLALGLQKPALDWSRVVYLGLILGVLVFMFSLYLRETDSEIYNDFHRLLLLAVLVAVCVLGLKVGTSVLGAKIDSSTVGYLNTLWLATAAMLVSALVGPHVGVAMAALLAVGTGLSLDIEIRFVAAAFVSSLAGIYAASHVRDRSSLVRMGVTLSSVNIVIVVLLSGFGGDLKGNFLSGLTWAIGCGMGSALLFWLGVALLERPFGVVTHVGLLELCDTNRPILKRLLMEAPGTYHHSLVVASLCEGAAETVGADALLVRAMAYYHDIGKLRRPQFFVENQRVENIHDRLNPSLSMLVIAAHVRDGIEMARDLKLPPPIVDGIREHHGTGLVTYFYHQAAGAEGPSPELEHQFRYDGPKPQTKETAILMLADGVEAASRVLQKPTPGQIEDLIGRILHDRLNDGQLDECDLTFRDLDGISQSFSRALTAMLHSRIEYPKVIPAGDAKKALKYASLHPKPDESAGAEPEAVEDTDSAAAAG